MTFRIKQAGNQNGNFKDKLMRKKSFYIYSDSSSEQEVLRSICVCACAGVMDGAWQGDIK